MNDKILAAGAIALGALGVAAAADAPAKPTVERKSVLNVTLPARRPVGAVEASTVIFGPGQASGRHLHPHPVVGLVTDGVFVLEVEGEVPVTLKTGEGFYEPADHTILRFDNASPTAPATMTAFYLVGDKSKPVTVMLTGK